MHNPITGQPLKPGSASLCLQIEKSAARFFPKANSFLLALSGGADSTALAVIFRILAARRGFGLAALHVNHCLRPEAGKDADFTRELCARLGIPLRVAKFDIATMARQQGTGLEETGRKARYAELAREAAAAGAHVIATGHQAGDLCEDILMRLCRGAAWPALGGMAMRNGKLFRPLLHTSASKLRQFLATEDFSWREDASNSDLRYKRNRFRHKILPQIFQENPAFERQAIKLERLAGIDADFFGSQLESILAECPWQEAQHTILLPRLLLNRTHPALRLRLYARAAKRLLNEAQVRTEALLELDAAYSARKTGKKFQLPGEVAMLVRRDGILFQLCKGRQP